MLHALVLSLGQMARPPVLRLVLRCLLIALVVTAGLALAGWQLLVAGIGRTGLADPLLPKDSALLSALSGLPISQSLAITGSINQMGEIQPIGGVNEKIEGFFDTCKAAGLTGQQGVLIPRRNVRNLMLRPDVIDAVAQGRFRIYAISHIDEAMELLTGITAGTRSANGMFEDGSVNANVELRLRDFAEELRDFLRPQETDLLTDLDE